MVRDFLPPVITRTIVQMRYGKKPKYLNFSGNYKSWEEALKHSAGYDTDVILEKVKNSALKVKRGFAFFERDSVAFGKPEYVWPVLAILLWVASQKNNSLNVVDFGGSLGSIYFQHKKFLSGMNELKWSVVEQENFVRCGKENFEDDVLKFFDTMESCARNPRADVCLLSSVLPYLKEPYEVLKEILSYEPSHIVLDRTAFWQESDRDDRITVQKVPAKIYDASYPAWFFNEKKFLDFFSQKYEFVAEFKAPEGTIELDGATAIYKGFLFKRL